MMNQITLESTESDIIQSVINGHKPNFELLIRKFNQQLFRIGIAYLKNDQDAQDAMQTTYMKAYEKLNTFNSNSRFSTWLIRIMINECLQLLRRAKVNNSEWQDHEYKNSDLDGIQQLMHKEMKELFEEAINNLPDKYGRVYVFRALNEYSVKDTAEFMGLTEENVKTRYHRARSLIKEQLLKKVGTKEAFLFLGQRCDHLTQSVMKMIMA